MKKQAKTLHQKLILSLTRASLSALKAQAASSRLSSSATAEVSTTVANVSTYVWLVLSALFGLVRR